MANILRTISLPVGIRNGRPLLNANTPPDLATVTELFDRISAANGGTAKNGKRWAGERTTLIAEVTAQIITFQTVNRRPLIDGVVDPNGGSLRLMNQLADDPPPTPGGGISATVVPAPGGLAEEKAEAILVADVNSLSGTGQLRPSWPTCAYSRRLVRVEGSSIKWFGVVVPLSITGGNFGTVPHINFTPSPHQGKYYDPNYESFNAWAQLWDDYTRMIGGQMTASGADQILVIPFYKNAQLHDLGSFLNNWQDVVSAVVTATVNSVDLFRLRDTFRFERIVSSSFSNGWIPHKQFHTQAVGASAKTDVLFDLDGQAAHPSSIHWRPANGVIYLDKPPSARGNPVGMQWYVGGCWNNFRPLYNATTHAYCRNHLLYHGLWQYCT